MTESVSHPTACLALADGTIFYGRGFGATGVTVAEHPSMIGETIANVMEAA